MLLTITSPAFQAGGVIPTRYTRDGENLSPPLEWRDAPPDTKSFVLIVEDLDAPSGTFRHWRSTTFRLAKPAFQKAPPAGGAVRQARG